MSTKRQIKQLRDSIKRKHRSYQLGILQSEELLEKQLKPIVDPLKKFVSVKNLKHEIDKNEKMEREEKRALYEEEKGPLLKTPQKSNIPVYQSPHRISKVLQSLINDTSNTMDHVYGAYMVDNKWKIGNKDVLFDDNKLQIDEKIYKLTSGLYELVFKKIPENIYNTDDMETYGEILSQTNAHLQGYDSNRQINSNKGYKYVNIIKPLMKKETEISGSGMLLTNNNIDYVYWDSPDELCDRLRLLLASNKAGNSGHMNEINSIIEELRENGIIKGGALRY
jgi:hypothetical protein